MYRHRNLDIFITAGVALLGGAAFVAKVPGPVQVVLGVALFFAPGYLWSEAILSQRLPGVERVLTTAGMTLILPILGGFLFYGLGISLKSNAWVGLLVVLTLLGVIAAAIVRLRAAPEDASDLGRGRQPGRPPEVRKFPTTHSFIFGVAAVVALASVAYSVKSADNQKSTLYTALGMTQVGHTNNPTKADLSVENYQGQAEQYEVQLYAKNKLIKTWTFTLSVGDSWQQTIAYTNTKYQILAKLYMQPDLKTVYRCADNGITGKLTCPGFD
jgi:Protein of unknown function (DUF1616)